MRNGLNGRVVVVTGASSGIGAALARACSECGAHVVLAARRAERLAEVAAMCEGEPVAVACDVTHAGDRRRLVDETLALHRRIDVLLNNAGIGLYAPFEETTDTSLREMFEVNFFSMFHMTQAVLPTMREAARGAIVNMASTGGLIAHTTDVSAYLAAKHAVVGMSRGLRRDLEGTGISVQVVCPHLTDTEFFGAGIGADRMHKAVESVRGKMDTPDEVAEGTVSQIGVGPFVVFPTARSEAAFARFKEQ